MGRNNLKRKGDAGNGKEEEKGKLRRMMAMSSRDYQKGKERRKYGWEGLAERKRKEKMEIERKMRNVRDRKI